MLASWTFIAKKTLLIQTYCRSIFTDLNSWSPSMPAPVDLTGHRYGRITVLSKADQKTSPRKWVCRCDCGNTKEINGSSLRRGATTSCGCFHKENHTTHGSHGSRLYSIWTNMKRRCYGVNSDQYPEYGARGVIVCDEWKESFSTFQSWAKQNGYADNLSIDRIDDAPLYSPSTCRWATDNVQSRNQRPRKNATSKYRGVYFQKTIKKWRARIYHNGTQIHLGVFEDELSAALARDAYIKENNLEGFPLNIR